MLELLKTIQQTGTQTKCTPANQRRATLDENSCLQCLKYCLRCQDAARKLAISPAGLYTLAACIMSTVNQSRLLTLEVSSFFCFFFFLTVANAKFPVGFFIRVVFTTAVDQSVLRIGHGGRAQHGIGRHEHNATPVRRARQVQISGGHDVR